MRCLRIAGVASLVCVLAVSAHGANILLVGGAFGDNNDEALRQALQSLGHFVPRPAATFAAAPPTAANLAETDLILVSRSANSGDYDDTVGGVGEGKLWNELDTPLLLMSAAHIRGGTASTTNRRWGWVDSTTTVDNAPGLENFDAFPNPSHAFVAGRTTNVYPDQGVVDITIDYINTQTVPTGATVVATLTHTNTADPPVTNTFAAIVDYPTGTTMFADDNGDVTTTLARRAYMQMHDYQDNANVFALTPNGLQILDQMIRTLAPTTSVPADVNGNGVTDVNDYNIIRMNMFGTGKTYAQGDVTGDGTVNFADFRYWKNFNGATSAGPGGGASVGAVPEPASIALGLLAALALLGGAMWRQVR